MKFRQKPSGIWMIDYDDNSGARKRMSTGIKTPPLSKAPPEVLQVGRSIVLGVHTPRVPTSPHRARKGDGRVTVSDLFDKCEKTVWHPDEAKSQATIHSNLRILRPLIGDVPVKDVSFSRLEELAAALKGRGYAPSTIKRKLDTVGKALRMATMWTDEAGQPLLVAKPAMPTIRVANMRDRILSPIEEAALFAAAEKRRQDEPGRPWFRLIALLEFLLDTGARLGEALGIGPESVTTMGADQYVTFARYKTKNDKPRSIPLTPRVLAALASLAPHLGKSAGGEWRFFPISPGTSWYLFNQLRGDVKAQTGMNLDDVTLHTLRHTTITRLARGGMDLLRLQKWAGHSDPNITAQRYTHLRPTDLAGGLSILIGSNPAPPANSDEDGERPVIMPVPEARVNRANAGAPTIN